MKFSIRIFANAYFDNFISVFQDGTKLDHPLNLTFKFFSNSAVIPKLLADLQFFIL